MRAIRTLAESKARVRELRRRGYHVKVINLPDGTRIVLRSHRPFVCTAHHHCTQQKKARR